MSFVATSVTLFVRHRRPVTPAGAASGKQGNHGAPWGGYKHSGFGRTMGADSVLNYTQVKTVSIRGTR